MPLEKLYILVTNFSLIHQKTNELSLFEWKRINVKKSSYEFLRSNHFIQSEITSEPIKLERCGLHSWLRNLKSFNFVTNFFGIGKIVQQQLFKTCCKIFFWKIVDGTMIISLTPVLLSPHCFIARKIANTNVSRITLCYADFCIMVPSFTHLQFSPSFYTTSCMTNKLA